MQTLRWCSHKLTLSQIICEHKILCSAPLVWKIVRVNMLWNNFLWVSAKSLVWLRYSGFIYAFTWCRRLKTNFSKANFAEFLCVEIVCLNITFCALQNQILFIRDAIDSLLWFIGLETLTGIFLDWTCVLLCALQFFTKLAKLKINSLRIGRNSALEQ